MVTELRPVQTVWIKLTKEVEMSFLCATRRLDLIHIPIQQQTSLKVTE